MKSLSLFCLLAVPLVAVEPISLDSLVAEITAQNPEVKFYEAELAAARAGQRGAAALRDPELSVEVGRKRVTTASGMLAGEGTAWSVTLAQPFEWPGRLALRKSLANRQVELAELGLARFEAALTAHARLLAYQLTAARQKSEATSEVAMRYRELREVFLQRDPAGLTPLLETRVIEAQELALQRRATEARLAAQAALTELNQLRGAALDSALEFTSPPPAFPIAPAHEVLLTAALEGNFEFRAAKLELESQGLAVSLARHERKPDITLSPYYSEEKAGDRERTFGLGFTVPLPLTARHRASVGIAEARRAQAETALLLAQRKLARDILGVAQTYAAKQAEVAAWSPDSAQKFREAAALADRHYRLGAVPLATYVELQNAYLDAVEALTDTQRETLAAGQQLQLLTGLTFNAPNATQP